MKKKHGLTGKIFSLALAFLIIVQVAPLTVAGLGAELGTRGIGSEKTQNDVLPDVDNGAWEIPEAAVNPNKVDMTINNGIVYNDHVYKKLLSWGYLTGYHSATDPYTGYWRDYTASLGPLIPLEDLGWINNHNGSWIDNQYVTTAVKRSKTEYGIYKNLAVPALQFGGSYVSAERGAITEKTLSKVVGYSKANLDQAILRISARGGDSAKVEFFRYSHIVEPDYSFTSNGIMVKADLNIKDYLAKRGSYPYTEISVDGNWQTMSGIHVVMIDNTSPSIQGVDVTQEGGQLVVKLKTNEGVRWAAGSVGQDLNDIWIEVDLQVVGTDYTETVRAHVSGIDYKYKENDYSNTIVFKGDLGPFAELDYKVLDISNVNVPKKDYPITFGTMMMVAYQTNDSRIRNQVLSKWDAVNKVTVYETYNTTAICDTAGNPINLESIVNWPINQKEIKNDSTFVRKIEFINDKTLLGGDMSKAEDFMEDITRADYFFGPGDEITTRLSLNKILTADEVNSFRVKTNLKDESGNYLWLSPKGTGSYFIGKEEFMYIDFETFTLDQSMSADAQNGSRAYLEVTDVECEMTSSPELNKKIPSAEKTLYIDLLPPVVTVKSNSLEEPEATDGYFKLDIQVDIADELVDDTLYSGVLEENAYFYLGANVNEETPVRFVVDTSATAPSSVDGYTGIGELVEGGRIKLNDRGMGMTSDAGNTVYIHLLVPEKANLLLNDFKVYAEVSDTVGNKVDTNYGHEVAFRIDRQKPEIKFMGSSTVFTSDSAITTVKVEATDYNNVESVSYQWVEAGSAYDDGKWEPAVIEASSRVIATITEQFSGMGSVNYDMMLYVKCRDDRGNESIIIQRNEKITLEKPTTVYEVVSDLSSPSTHPEIIIKGPDRSAEDKAGYTRVTVSPLNPREDWMYVTVVKSGEEKDLFKFEGQWYKVATSGSLYTFVEAVDGETVTLDDLKKYYGNVKISFENAYMDLTPVLGYVDDTVTDGSYYADQNFITARFASQDSELDTVNAVNFGKITDKEGGILSSDGDKGGGSILVTTDLRGVNRMSGITFYFDIKNVRMDDWGLLDIDFERSTVELLRSDKNLSDELVFIQTGLAHSDEQYFAIPSETQDGEWFKTGTYRIRITVKSRSGSVDVFESLNIVYDAGIPQNYGLVSYSHDLRYETGAYRTMYSGDPIDSFGIAVQPGREVSRNNVFAVYSGGVTGFSFTIGADDTSEVYDGYTVGAIEGFRYWNSLSAPTEEDLAGFTFARYASSDRPCLIVTSGVESIYTEDTIPKGADGLGDIYLVEGVNTICYQVKMENGYISPVRQFTIIVTQYIPEFNVIVEDYTPSYYAAQRDGQVNAHDITMKIDEAFSLNGSGNVNVEVWSNYSMEISGAWVEQTYDNSLTMSLTCLASNLKAGDTATLTRDSYTSCFPPYSGQGNQCSAVFAAIDEYGGMVVFAPQIGALSRLNEPSDPYDDLITIEYYGSYQDDPFVIGRDLSFIEIYNDAVYFGAELVGFQTLRSTEGGEYVVVEKSIPELQYNLFAIDSNDVVFSGYKTAWAHSTTSAVWNVTEGKLDNYELIDWDNTKITLYDGEGNVLAEGLNMNKPGSNAAGFVGYSYGEVYERAWEGNPEKRYMQFSLKFANPMADAEHPAYDRDKNYDDEVNLNSLMAVSFRIDGVTVLGDEFETEGELDLRYIDYSTFNETMTGSGIVLGLPFVSADGTREIYTGVFNGQGQSYTINVTDAYGTEHTISGAYSSNNFDEGTHITFSKLEKTSKAVEITIRREDGKAIYIDVTDAEIIAVEGNGTSLVKVTVSESISFSYKYIDGNGNEVSKTLEVGNIVKPDPRISVDVDTSVLLVDDDGTLYRYGNVVIKLVDDNFALTDIYTGSAPSFTFTPDGARSYIFSKDEIVATFGDEEPIAIPRSLGYEINFELREVIDPLVQLTVADAPSVKISAFKEDRGYYEDMKLALILEPTGIEDSIVEGDGTTFKYAGKRANASAFLSKLGWGSGYRFLAEVTFNGAYKTFIKQGIYTEAPDYMSGMSDTVDGVTLNGRLITVEKNTQFTFFVVAKNGNYTSVVFDVTDIGDAPKPSTVKVPIDDKTVKVYIVKPEGVTDFNVTPADVGLEVKSDADGDYAGVPYVEYDKNDDYIINYSFIFNGEEIKGQLDTSIYEIRVREMKQNGVISWSANKTLEATDKEISATLSFSEVVSSVEVLDVEIDSSKVTVSHSGRQVTIKFLDNHEGFTLKVSSSYGDVVITVGGVENIDREAPEVKEISRELSKDGKTVTVTIATSERTVFREGGYIGEQAKDEEGNEIYVYTREITENGSYTYHFTDMSGIESVIKVEINEIVTEELGVLFSTDKDKDTAVADPSDLALEAGDKVYLIATRDVKVVFNGGDEIEVAADEWHELTLDEVGGAAPYVTVTDEYGSVVIRQFSQIVPADTEAPIVTVQKNVISVTAGSDRAVVEELLLANVSATDRDAELTYSVEFAEDISVSGLFTATYTVTDSSGNAAVAECRLRVVSGAEPKVSINTTPVDREGTYYAESGEELTLTVDVGGQPYCVYTENGIKTVAQMKIGSTDVTDGYVKDATVELGEFESGYYTLIVQTQSRDYFRIIIYVY